MSEQVTQQDNQQPSTFVDGFGMPLEIGGFVAYTTSANRFCEVSVGRIKKITCKTKWDGTIIPDQYSVTIGDVIKKTMVSAEQKAYQLYKSPKATTLFANRVMSATQSHYDNLLNQLKEVELKKMSATLNGDN